MNSNQIQTMKNLKIIRLLAATAMAGLLAASPIGASAQQHQGTIGKSVIGPCPQPQCPVPPAPCFPFGHVGDVVNARLNYINADTFGDAHRVDSMVDSVFHTSGTVNSPNLLAAPVTLANLGDGVERQHTFIIEPTDGTDPSSTPPFVLTDRNTVLGVDLGTGLPFELTFRAGIVVLRPAIDITKTCRLIGDANNPVIEFTLTIRNTGQANTKLFNIRVVDNNGTPGNPADDVTFGDGVPAGDVIPDLDPGATHVITGTYVATSNPSVNTATVVAFDALGRVDPNCPGARVTDTATCEVSIPCNPAIRVTKDCVVVGQLGAFIVNYSGTVFNDGNVPLTGITVQDNKGGAPINVGNLAPGASAPYAGSYSLPANTPCSTDVSDTVTATGTFPAICAAIGGVHTVSATDSATCTTPPCKPEIEVLKEVACYLPGDNCGTFAKVATGVKDSDCPAFCYRIRVSNVGVVPVATLTVNDPVLGGNISGLFGPLPIAPGDSRTAIIKPITHCQDTPDTVTATGSSADGASDTDTDDALARVLVIDLVCESTLFSSVDMDNNTNDCNVLLPDSAPVRLNVVFRNNGNAPLDITSIAGLPPLFDCADNTTPVVVALPIHLEPGASVTIAGCINHDCTGPDVTLRIIGHAEANDNNGTLCVYDRTGQRITDASGDNDCVCTIRCENPVTCRVTGGGVLIPGFVDQSCIAVNTTIFPFTSPNGLTIKKITHGGQLGAPFAEMDCGAILGNPCIRGQWSHTRHYEGTANPRDVFDMNFHSQTPKGVYDSLSCVCLGCCDPGTGAFIPPSLGPLVHKFQICNPDDHKVCGPMPRPAPANAIIWSGIGKVTPTDDVRGSRAAQAEWVVFRIYIEDRSEPGGGHPGGAVEPADIYCFQAWKTGIKVSKKPDFTTISTAFRQALGEANCDFLEGLEGGAFPIGTLPSPIVGGVTADIQDCGPMHDGNHQIHPSTSATCTE